MNILVTGVGAIIGYGIINSLRQGNEKNIRIIGMDIFDDAYGQFLCDAFYVAERADSDNYIPFLLDLIEKENIDLIIPGIEQDMYKMSIHKDIIPTRIVLNNELLISLSKDKLHTYQYLKEHTDINLIPTLHQSTYEECVAQLGSPFLIKPRSSYASKGIHIIRTQEEFEWYNKDPEKNIFQRIIGQKEEEYTISIFGNGEGDYLDFIILKRLLAPSGATDKAQVIADDANIEDYIKSLCKVLKPIGPTNIQIRKEGEKVYLLEVNPRISSACSIRTAAGYNEPLHCIDFYIKEKKELSTQPKKPIRAIRYIADYYYE